MNRNIVFLVLLILLMPTLLGSSFAAPNNEIKAINKIPSTNPNIDKLILVEGNPATMSAHIKNGKLHIKDNLHTQRQVRLNYIELFKNLKGFNGQTLGYTHINDYGITTRKIIDVGEIDNQGFISMEMTFSTVIIDGMTGTTTTTLTGLSGNQSISVPDGSSYDLNITNNQASTDGKNYQNKSIITINGSMVTTETGIPLQLFTNLEGVNGTGDIGIAYTNSTAIPREIEAIWGSDNVSIHFSFNTTSGVDSEFVVLWGADNNTEPASDSAYGSGAVWDNIAVWNMNNDPNGDAANSIKDSTENSYDGTPVGSMTTADLVDTDYSKAIDFDGTDDRIVINSADFLDSKQSGSVHFRIYPHVSELSYMGIYSTTSSVNSLYGFAINADDTVQISYKYAGGAGNQYIITSDETININEWNDVTFASTGTTHKIIVNGVDSSLTGNVGAAAGGWFADINELANTHYFHIGHFFRSGTTTANEFDGLIDMADISDNYDVNYLLTTHKNFNNPTATNTNPFYLSIGETQQLQNINITASITGDSNTQSYNTSQSREFTLTPTGTTNNLFVNTTGTNYNVNVTTYWTEDTVKYTETIANGFANTTVQYTPSFNITSGILNSTYNLINFVEHDYTGTLSTLVDGVNYDSNSTRDGNDVNVSIVNFDTSTHWINFSVAYNPPLDLYTPIDDATLNYTFPPLNHDVYLSWMNTTGIYKYEVYQGATVKRSGTVYTNSTTVSLPAGDYTWLTYGYDDIFNEYSLDSESFDFTISTNITYENTTGVHGVIYDYLIGIETPLPNAGVYLWNDTYSASAITNSDGYFVFTGLTNSTYFLIAKKDRYYDSSTEVATLTTNNMTEHNIRLIENTGTDYSKHYVKFILKSFFGRLYSDVLVNVYIGDSTTIFKSDITGTDGSVTFDLTQTQEYRFTFVNSTQDIDITKVITPSDTLYKIIVFGTNIIPDEPASDDILYTVQGININTTYGFINVSFTDTSNTTSLAELWIKDKDNQSTLYHFNTSDSTKEWSQIVDGGNASYLVVFKIDNAILTDTLTITRTIYFDNDVNINLGLENNWTYILIAVIIITTVALLSSRLNSEIMSVITVLTGWLMMFFGWLTAGMTIYEKITVGMMLLLATLIAFATIIKKGEK